jgi:hypothetical protein
LLFVYAAITLYLTVTDHMMGKLMGAFDRSKEEGQAQWKKTRQAVLRRRAEAEAYARRNW